MFLVYLSSKYVPRMAQMDNSDSVWELAMASTLRVSSIAAKLAAEKKRPGKQEKNLGELAGRLLCVHAALGRPSLDQ